MEDYLRTNIPTVEPKIRESVLQVVVEEPSINLDDLFQKTEECSTRDDIHRLIACGDLFVDFAAKPLIEPHEVRVFPNKETADAYSRIVEVPSSAISE